MGSIAVVSGLLGMVSFAASAETRDITFPVIGNVSYSDDFGAPRSGGRTHEGNDLLGSKMLPLVAAVDGRVRFVPYPEPEYGYYVSITDADGFRYNYLHINNDTPGTDDGNGGGLYAYAPNMDYGSPVVKGQLIGWMGDSGNAEGTTPHLHFEMRHPDGSAFSPYDSLNAAPHISSPFPSAQRDDEILPFDEFTGGGTVAVGNFDEGERAELVIGAGAGGGPNVRIVEQNGDSISTFFAFDPAFTGGVDVAAGDTDGDGIDEVIVGAGPGMEPIVRVFQVDGTVVSEFLAYPADFRGGVSVASGDTNGDGMAEIATGAGPGGGPQVRIFKANGKVIGSFFAFDTAFRGGVDVAIKPHTELKTAKIIVAPGPGGGPNVRVLRLDGSQKESFFAYDQSFRGGVRLSVGNIQDETARYELATAPASGGGADVRLFRIKNGDLLEYGTAYEEWWRGAFDIGAGTGELWISSGPGGSPPNGRRVSVREVEGIDNFDF